MKSTESLVKKVVDERQKIQDGHIYEEIFGAILEQRLTPGTKLSEDTLGEIFGVSRTVVRANLQRLAHENIVEIIPHRGAFVARPSVEDAEEILQARCLIEDGIIRAAADKATAADIKRLRKSVRQEQLVLDSGNRAKWIRLSGNFHLLLAGIAGNKTMAGFLKELVSRTSLVILEYQKVAQSACDCVDHNQIIDALAQGDGGKCAKLMHDHLMRLRAQLDLSAEDKEPDLYAIFSAGNAAE